MMSDRITITVDEDTRARLDAHPEITPGGMFKKAAMEMDRGKTPEETIAWKEIEIARIGLEKAKMDFELGRQRIEIETRHYEAEGRAKMANQQMEIMQLERERTAEQNKRDADRPATKQEITRAKFEVARAKDTLNWLLEACKATDNDQNRYVSAYADSIVDLKETLGEGNITALDAKNAGEQGSEIGQELNRMLRTAINQTQDQKDPFDVFSNKNSNEEDPDPRSPLWDHAQQIHGLVKDGKTHDEIVQFYKENHPALWSPREKYATKSQIRYWYDHFTTKRSEEE